MSVTARSAAAFRADEVANANDQPSRAEVCVAACADAWRADGEILASPMGTIPRIGAWLAKETFAPDLLLTDGEARLLANPWAAEPIAEGWLPFRAVFDLLATGRRHVMMGPAQLSRYGDANISAIGPHARPTAQLLGVRGAPGNTANHATSYWVARHSPRVFVEDVDMVSGVGTRRGAALRFHDLRRVVTNLAVLDFGGPERALRLVSTHPGVTVDDVAAATGFKLAVNNDVTTTRQPTGEELRLIREVLDPGNARAREVPEP
jgi:acyl CoA:acetate/3-ketoacid CoA transferase beta subunit